MATRQKNKPESPNIVGSISRLAGALVGTAVVTGRRVVRTVTPPSGGLSGKPKKKPIRAPAKRKKKAVRKPKTKRPKQKKKVTKQKRAGSPRKSKTSKKKPASSSAKKKKGITPNKKKKTVQGVDAEMNVPIEKQEPQLLIAKAEMADEKFSSANVSPEAGTEENGTTGP